jgi:cell division protein FtsW
MSAAAGRSLPAAPTLRPLSAVARNPAAYGRRLLGIAVGLTAFGLVMVYSSTAVKRAVDGHDPNARLLKQLAWVAVAGLVAWAAATVPLSRLRRHAHHLVIAVLVALAVVLVFGKAAKGSRRWLELGPVTVQPSEFLKIAVLVYLADRLARREEDPFRDAAPWPALLAPVGIGIVLVMAEPDLGTSIFVGALAVVLLGLAGVRPGHLLPIAVAAVPLLIGIAASKFQHVRERLRFLVEGEDASRQLKQAVIAVGSGGVFGVGLGAGTQKLWKVPEIQTDFIFSVIGEELGFVGAAAVVIAFLAFLVHGKRIAEQAHRTVGAFPYYLAWGATFVVAFQALVNVAVVTACAPTKGVSLPFISLGGSNLVTAFAAVGLIVNVSRAAAAEARGEPFS